MPTCDTMERHAELQARANAYIREAPDKEERRRRMALMFGIRYGCGPGPLKRAAMAMAQSREVLPPYTPTDARVIRYCLEAEAKPPYLFLPPEPRRPLDLVPSLRRFSRPYP